MPNKKPAKNAFSFYLDYAMTELRREGNVINSKQDAVPFAHGKWQSMSEDEKAPYKEKAADWKMRVRGTVRRGRLDCAGCCYSRVSLNFSCTLPCNPDWEQCLFSAINCVLCVTKMLLA